MKVKLKIISLCLCLLLAGCGGTIKTVEKPLFIKCRVPEIPKAELESLPENATYPEKLKIILNNYLKLERENKMLREVIEACR